MSSQAKPTPVVDTQDKKPVKKADLSSTVKVCLIGMCYNGNGVWKWTELMKLSWDGSDEGSIGLLGCFSIRYILFTVSYD